MVQLHGVQAAPAIPYALRSRTDAVVGPSQLDAHYVRLAGLLGFSWVHSASINGIVSRLAGLIVPMIMLIITLGIHSRTCRS